MKEQLIETARLYIKISQLLMMLSDADSIQGKVLRAGFSTEQVENMAQLKKDLETHGIREIVDQIIN